MSSSTYLLAGRVSELERLKLQSRVWEPSGRRLLGEIGNGSGVRAVDIGCGVMGWLRLLSQWVGPDGEVVGTDIDDAMLAAATQFVAEEALENVTLLNDDLFATRLEPSSFDLVHARFVLTPLGRGHEQMETYVCGPRSWRSHRDIPTCGCRCTSAPVWNRGCGHWWTPRSCTSSTRKSRPSFRNPGAGAPRSR